jgi:dihydroxy-acid dehydratase
MSRFDKSRLPSRHVTEGAETAPMRAMMLGTGLAPEDLDRPLIGVATTWSEILALQHASARSGAAREDRGP